MLKGKVAVVTGGAQGIGKAIAGKLLAAGATVVIAALDDAALANTSAEFESKGLAFRSYGVDLSEESGIQSLVSSMTRDLGPADILVNNAGVTGPTLPVHEVTTGDWD